MVKSLIRAAAAVVALLALGAGAALSCPTHDNHTASADPPPAMSSTG